VEVILALTVFFATAVTLFAVAFFVDVAIIHLVSQILMY
jgi:hypothetical protein